MQRGRPAMSQLRVFEHDQPAPIAFFAGFRYLHPLRHRDRTTRQALEFAALS